MKTLAPDGNIASQMITLAPDDNISSECLNKRLDCDLQHCETTVAHGIIELVVFDI